MVLRRCPTASATPDPPAAIAAKTWAFRPPPKRFAIEAVRTTTMPIASAGITLSAVGEVPATVSAARATSGVSGGWST